jgi:polar amino acid transport system substrate-binding protein
MRSSWIRPIFPLVALGATVIVGCGSSSSSSSTPTNTTPAVTTPAAVSSIQSQVPAALKSKGTLTVAADASYAPNEFVAQDGHTVIGMDPDLMKAIGALMGVKVNVINVPFASILTGLSAGKYDVGASSFTDTLERQKTVDFVDYFIAGENFFTKSQGGTDIGSIADICGHTVAVESGTTEKDDAATQSAKCVKEGKPAVTSLVFPDQNGANLALTAGRAQLVFVDTPVADYQVKQSNGQFKIVGATYANAPYGLAVAKNSGLAAPILSAVKLLMQSGTYSNILAKWGLESGAIPISGVKINGAKM